ncbi:MAG TPA: 16S rRNA (cytidine(1402)-2'-O)-methyltransferase [Pyrinomonadaceae bacterium]|nr:16S rRNA (cytidine(1402)-2'-O)-methyltransferase [Pyrinomonadaceae bacterium]
MLGTLYIVATPIGNLADITQRAIQTLKDVDIIAAEDTRHTHKLLQHYGINTKTTSYHEHNEQQRSEELLARLREGNDVAIVSDAGTPGINDPAFRLVRLALDNNIPVVPVPGPSAFLAALVASGLPTDEFFFAGFLPSRSGARRTRLNELRSIASTLIFYEAPHRLRDALEDALEVLGPRQAVVARELTKIHEEFRRGKLNELAEYYSNEQNVRGEIVLIIDRSRDEDKSSAAVTNTELQRLVARLEDEGLDHRAALKKAARELGMSRDEAYRRLTVARRQ